MFHLLTLNDLSSPGTEKGVGCCGRKAAFIFPSSSFQDDSKTLFLLEFWKFCQSTRPYTFNYHCSSPHYSLKVCVSNSYAEILTQDNGPGDGALGRLLDHRKAPSWMRLVLLEIQSSLVPPSYEDTMRSLQPRKDTHKLFWHLSKLWIQISDDYKQPLMICFDGSLEGLHLLRRLFFLFFPSFIEI